MELRHLSFPPFSPLRGLCWIHLPVLSCSPWILERSNSKWSPSTVMQCYPMPTRVLKFPPCSLLLPPASLVFSPALYFRRRLKHHRLNGGCLASPFAPWSKKGIKAHRDHETTMGPRASPVTAPIFTNWCRPPRCQKPLITFTDPFSRGDKNAWVESSCGFSRVSELTTSTSRCHRLGRAEYLEHQISVSHHKLLVTSRTFDGFQTQRAVAAPRSVRTRGPVLKSLTVGIWQQVTCVRLHKLPPYVLRLLTD